MNRLNSKRAVAAQQIIGHLFDADHTLSIGFMDCDQFADCGFSGRGDDDIIPIKHRKRLVTDK